MPRLNWNPADVVDYTGDTSDDWVLPVPQKEERGFFGHLGTGGKHGLVDQNKEVIYGAAGLAGAATGYDPLRDWGFQNHQQQAAATQADSDPAYHWSGVNSVGDGLGTFLPYWLGYGGSQILTGLGAGAAGSFAAKKVFKESVERGAAEYMASHAAKQEIESVASHLAVDRPLAQAFAEATQVVSRKAVQQAADTVGKYGFYGALGTQGVGMELGATYNEAGDYALEQGKTLDDVDLGPVVGYGLGAGALEAASDVVTLGATRLLPGGAKPFIDMLDSGGRAARMAKRGLLTSQVGGLTELAQTGLEARGAGKPGAEDDDLITSYLAGMIGEGAIGSLGGIPTPPSAPAAPQAPWNMEQALEQRRVMESLAADAEFDAENAPYAARNARTAGLAGFNPSMPVTPPTTGGLATPPPVAPTFTPRNGPGATGGYGFAAKKETPNVATQVVAPGGQVPGTDQEGSGAGGTVGGVGQRAEGSGRTPGAQPGAGTVVPMGDALPASAALTKYAIGKKGVRLAASMEEHLRMGTIDEAEFDSLMLRLAKDQFVPKQREALAKEFSSLVIERMTGKPAAASAPAPIRLQDEQKQPGDVVTWTAQQIAENNLDLSGQQQTAMDVLNDAAKTGDLGQFIDAEGTFILPALAKATGISPGALKVQLTRVKDKIEKSTGASMVEALRQRERDMRVVQAPDTDLAGLSPSEQRIVVDEAEIFGTEDGGEQSMGIIDSVGGSQSETGEDKAATAMAAAEPNPVADARAAAAMAKFEREQEARQRFVLQQPIAAEAAKMWDKWRLDMADPASVPVAADLREQYAYEWVLAYQEWSDGSIDDGQIESDQQNIAELNQATAPEPRAALAAPTAGGITEGPRSDGQTGQRLGSENGRQDQAPARLEAPVAPAGPSESDSQPVESPPVEAVDPDADLMDALQRIAAKKDGKSSKIATSYIREAMLAQTEEEGAEVRRRAGEWANAVLGEEPGAGKFSVDGSHEVTPRLLSWLTEVFRRRAKTPVVSIVPVPNEVMNAAGVYRPVVLDVEHARHIFNVHPEVSPEVLAALPSMLKAPRLVLTNGKSLTFVVDAWVNGTPIAIILNNATLKDGTKVFKVTEVSSAFGLDDSAVKVAAALREGNVKYVRQNEVARLQELLHGEPISPLAETGYAPLDDGLDVTVATDSGNVNLRVRKPAAYEGKVFSLGITTSGQPATTLREKLLKAFAAPYFFDRRVVVVQSQSELPPDVAQSAKGKKVLGFFENKTQKVYLIADNIAEGTELSVLLHEVGVHAGMRNLLGTANYDALVGQLKRWLEVGGDTVEGKLAIKAYMRMKNAEGHTPGQAMNSRQSEELLAYFVEEAVKAGIDPTAVSTQPESLRAWFRRLWAAVKVAIRKLNLNPDTLTAQGVVDLAYGAAQLEMNTDLPTSEKGADPESRMFSIADDETIKATVAALPTSLQKPALRVSRTIKDVLKRGLYGSMFGHDLVDAMTVHLKSARGYFDLLSEKEVMKQTYEAQIEDIMIRAYQVKDKDALNVFLKSSTRKGLWGFKPEWDKTAQVDTKQKVQFDALSPEAQQVAKDMFRRGAEYRNELRKVITDAMTSEFAVMDEAAVSPAEKKKIEQRKLKQMRLFDKSFGTILGPYVPLSRFGGFVMVAKSARMRAAEEAKDAKLIEELESDPSHRVVMFADSMGEAMELRDEMATHGFTADAFEKEYYHQQMSEAPWSAISRLKTMVMQEFGDGKDNRAVRAINTMLSDLYLSTVAEASARRHEMRRRNIEGASDDMLKSFASKGVADAHFIAALKNNGKLNKVLADMRGESAAAENKSEARRALNEILRRHALGLEFRPTPFQDKAMALTSFWMLLTNPRYYVMNALQTAMISVPYMAGKFGYARTWAETNKAYKELAVGFGGAKGFAHGEYDIDALSIPDADKQFLHALKNAGKLDIGISMDLGAWSADDSAASKAVNRMAHHTRTMARQVEVVNRVSAGLAAYRLAVQNGMSDPKRYAFDVVNRTHGDYTRMAAPRFLNMAPKVMTQFMKYKLIQWSLLARVGHDMLKGATKEERAAAAKSFTFMMSHSAVMTGAMATPPAYVVMLLASAMVGPDDDDDPRSLEERAREYIGDDTMADLLLRGAPAAAGADVSKYVGWEGVVNPTPFLAQDPMTRRGYADSMVGLSGPFLGGLLPRALDGINLMAGGDYWKGLEKMLPSLPSNALKAMREANNGVTLKNGDVVLQPEEIDFFDGMLQVLGVPPSTTASAQRDMRWAKDREQFFEDRVRELRNKYAKAYRDGDNGDMQDIREQWLNMQAAQRRLGIKPSSLSSLLKSPRAQEKREEDLAEQMSAI